LTNTPNLAMPYIDVGQSQKEVSHNEALNALDVLTQATVVNSSTTAPPGSPTLGQAWIVAATATGAWAGKEKQIAAWFGAWKFYRPAKGWRVYDQALSKTFDYDGTAWVDAMVRPSPTAQVPTLGLSWVGYGGGFQSPRYYKTPDGRVTIEGLMQSGTNGTVFTLLAGYRPAAKLMFVCQSGGGPYRVDVDSNGDVILSGSNSVFSSLSGISFFAV
jgi:Protein of unknown function (DUF2793)